MYVSTLVKTEACGIEVLIEHCDEGRVGEHWRVVASDRTQETREGCVVKGVVMLIAQTHTSLQSAWLEYCGVLRLVIHVAA